MQILISFANLLTLHSDIQTFAEYTVAPYMGAWIETSNGSVKRLTAFVAPYMGAWIETDETETPVFALRSHPIWVRGLKLLQRRPNAILERRTLYGCVD